MRIETLTPNPDRSPAAGPAARARSRFNGVRFAYPEQTRTGAGPARRGPKDARLPA